MTKIIGLTGGIGSGKSTVANYIASKGIPVYIADEEAKKIMEREDVKQKIQNLFSESVLNPDNSLNRKKIAEFVFNNPNKLKELNDQAYNSYIDFCVQQIRMYFSALRDSHRKEWNDSNSKLLSVISLNGFIIAYNRYIDKKKLEDFNFFNIRFKDLHTDFTREKFPYTSSQYKKFSDEILRDALLKG